MPMLAMSESTCWTLIESAAAGDREAREEFARRYLPVVRAYLGARWRARLSPEELEDAQQEVFVDCLREHGVLERMQPGRRSGFRPFLLGIVRTAALRAEAARARRRDAPNKESFHADEFAGDESNLSRVFDRAWAEQVMRAAAERQASNARSDGAEAERRVELLKLRFEEGNSMLEIAARWKTELPALHKEYARARTEFQRALEEVLAFHNPGEPEAIRQECHDLMSCLI
jgi:RNA polymerase sigma-70 factor (ECF subfamily)